MVNTLKMAQIHTILGLWRQGWSFRRIARELGVHRETVARHVREAATSSNPAIPTAGTEGAPGPDGRSKPAISTAGRSSRCQPHRGPIEAKLAAGLSAKRIHQDLVEETGFEGSYESVKRFVRHLETRATKPFRRMEVGPGEEGQIDFGKGAWIALPHGVPAGDPATASKPGRKHRRSHLLRIVLSCSRKGYSESVRKQDTETFIRFLENAFHYFGGAPCRIVPDNTKAAVLKADWYDPELNPKVADFCRHYGTVLLPTRSYTPRHKGKIESGIGYAQDNALKGRVFQSLEEQNRFLLHWEQEVADHRIHGTTRQQVGVHFEQVERQALLPLPAQRFPFFREARRKVHRDGHVEVERAFYSVPPEYLARELWVRWDSRLVRAFNDRFEQVCIHARKDRGRFSTQKAHLASEKISGVERGAEYLLGRARRIGSYSRIWTRRMVTERGIEGVRVLQGFLSLSSRHPADVIERACKQAMREGSWRLGRLRELCRAEHEQADFDFLSEHPLIRGMDLYQSVVSFQQEDPFA